MENKKEYTEPEMRIVHLERQTNLLDDSPCPGANCEGFGLAPHEQDPIA